MAEHFSSWETVCSLKGRSVTKHVDISKLHTRISSNLMTAYSSRGLFFPFAVFLTPKTRLAGLMFL